MKGFCVSLSLMLFVVSCATTPEESTRISEVYRPLETGAIIANGAIEVVNARIIDSPGYKGCTIQMVNVTDKPVTLAGIVRWYERDGAEARKGRPLWRNMTLMPGQPFNLSSVAPVPWCTEIGLEIRGSLN